MTVGRSRRGKLVCSISFCCRSTPDRPVRPSLDGKEELFSRQIFSSPPFADLDHRTWTDCRNNLLSHHGNNDSVNLAQMELKGWEESSMLFSLHHLPSWKFMKEPFYVEVGNIFSASLTLFLDPMCYVCVCLFFPLFLSLFLSSVLWEYDEMAELQNCCLFSLVVPFSLEPPTNTVGYTTYVHTPIPTCVHHIQYCTARKNIYTVNVG